MMASALGAEQVHQVAYLASSLCCIGAIGGLAQHSTARAGNALGMIGVGGGILTTVGHMSPSASVFAQMVGTLGAGGAIGYNIAKKVAITELPELTAAFHSSVGLAAVLTALSKHIAEYDSFLTDAVGRVNETSVYLGKFLLPVHDQFDFTVFGIANYGIIPPCVRRHMDWWDYVYRLTGGFCEAAWTLGLSTFGFACQEYAQYWHGRCLCRLHGCLLLPSFSRNWSSLSPRGDGIEWGNGYSHDCQYWRC